VGAETGVGEIDSEEEEGEEESGRKEEHCVVKMREIDR
jgi:hypothetical protein